MNCHRFQKFASAFADGELDVEQNLEALEHLNMCQTCARRVADIQQLKAALIRVTPDAPAPASLRERVLAALAAEAESPRGGADVEIYMDEEGNSDTIVLRPTARRRARYLVPLAMAAAVLFSVTVWQLLPLLSVRKNQATLRAQTVREVSDQHLRCVADPASHRDPTLGSSLPVVATRLSLRLGLRVLAPDLSGLGFTFVGADQCAAGGRTGAHVVYRSKAYDTLLSLFSLAEIPELDTSRGRRIGERSYLQTCAGGTRVTAWHEDGATYVACGGQAIPETVLLDVAETARKSDTR